MESHAGRLGVNPSCSLGEAHSFSTTSMEVSRLYLSPAPPRDHDMSVLTERKVGLLLSKSSVRVQGAAPSLPACWDLGFEPCGCAQHLQEQRKTVRSEDPVA